MKSTMRLPGAALLVGLGLIAAGPGAVLADDLDLALPEPPAVAVTVETADAGPGPEVRPAPAAAVEPAGESRGAAATVAADAPVRPVSDPPRAVEITLPEPPPAAIVLRVEDRLGGAVAARLEGDRLHPRLGKAERESMTAFYALGEFKPVWIVDGAWTRPALAVIERLRAAGEDALDPADYPVPPLDAASRDDAARLADADLKLSAAAVAYARDARGARIEPSRLSALITPKLELPSADQVLTRLAAASDAGEALKSFNPAHAGYRALKAKLAEIQSGADDRLEAEIAANMERWRWLPTELGARHILVNVPEYRLRLFEDGQATYAARVIVGRPETPTPLFSEQMDHAVVNPSWTVPPSIFKNEFNSDPAYAASRGYQVIQTRSGVTIRQPPGERNALGFIKFMFPNRHAVYLHDTPNRGLFSAERRAFSHGCVRLDQPFRFAELVLGREWTEGRLRGLIGRGERTIRLAQKLPVHIAHFTAFVDEGGHLRQVPDIYGVSGKVRAALKLPGGSPAVAAVARPDRERQASRRTRVMAEPGRPSAAHKVVRRVAAATEAPRRRHARPVQTAVPAPVVMPAESGFWWWTR